MHDTYVERQVLYFCTAHVFPISPSRVMHKIEHMYRS